MDWYALGAVFGISGMFLFLIWWLNKQTASTAVTEEKLKQSQKTERILNELSKIDAYRPDGVADAIERLRNKRDE